MTAIDATQRPSPGVILVADDSLVVRAVVCRQLKDQGYTVIEAEDGVGALRVCQESHPDAALLDIDMPRLDGHQVLQAMKADDAMADIPVVFLSGRTSTSDVVAGLRLGAHDYLKKPFEPAELVARVHSAVRMRRLQDELRERNLALDAVSRTDALTGLSNRRHGREFLDQRTADARRHGEPLSLLMFDIDHFKAVNDRYGHAGGDAVLQGFAARLGRLMREEDLACRWGGEEFLVVLARTDLSTAEAVGERVREAIVERPFAIGGQECAVTVSVGCATRHDDDPDELVHRADVALYAAKEGGRNRVVVAV